MGLRRLGLGGFLTDILQVTYIMQRREGDPPHNTRSKGWHEKTTLQREEIHEGIQGSESIAQWTLPAGLPSHVNEKLRGDDTDHGRAQQQHQDNDDSIQTPPDITGDISADDDVKRGDRATSGFKATLEKLRYVATKPDIVEKELLWQQQGKEGNVPAQAQFKEEILAQRHLRTFAIMCENSPFLTIGHSIGKFFADPGDENKGLHGKCVAFVGDRVQNRDPQIITLPNSAWDWVTPEVFMDYEVLEEYYHTSNGNHAKLFNPPDRSTARSAPLQKPTKKKGKKKKCDAETGESDQTEQTPSDRFDPQEDIFREIDIPRMLYLPTYIFGEIFHKQYWTPADLLEVIVEAEAEYDIQIENQHWQLMRHWCIAAMQPATPFGTSSHVATTVGAITQADDSFLAWCNFRIDTTLGERRVIHPAPSPGLHIPTGQTQSLPFPSIPPQSQAFTLPPQNAGAEIQTHRNHTSTAETQNAAGGPHSLPLPPHHTYPTAGQIDLAAEVGRGIAMGFQAFSNAGLFAQGAGAQGLPVAGVG